MRMMGKGQYKAWDDFGGDVEIEEVTDQDIYRISGGNARCGNKYCFQTRRRCFPNGQCVWE